MHKKRSGRCSRAALTVLGRLERDVAAVARGVRAVVMSQLPPLPMLEEPAVVERGNRHREAIFRAFVKNMRAGRQEVDKDFFRNAAIERAATGFPLELALHIYRLCSHELWRWLVREVQRVRGGKDAVVELTDGWFNFINAGSAALTEGYVRFEADRIADRERTLREVIDDLVVGRVGGREALQARARMLGLDATSAMRLVVAQPAVAGEGEEPRPLSVIRELLGATLRGAGEVVDVVRGTEVVALLHQERGRDSGPPAAWLQTLATLADATAIRVGISTLCKGFLDVPRGYEEALLALSLASSTNPVVSFGDMRIFDYLLTRVDRAALRLLPAWVHRLGKPAGRADRPLATTVLAYIEEGFNAGEAARRLRVHPNTVHYRLRRVTKITGLNTRRFDDMLQLLMVLRLADRVGGVPELATTPAKAQSSAE